MTIRDLIHSTPFLEITCGQYEGAVIFINHVRTSLSKAESDEPHEYQLILDSDTDTQEGLRAIRALTRIADLAMHYEVTTFPYLIKALIEQLLKLNYAMALVLRG